MKTIDAPADLFAVWESAFAFRLFAEQSELTLSIPEQIASRIGEKIINGLMAPGERVAEQELADAYAVSRGPVREAIRLLEREGLVTVLARRGAIVTELSSTELQELMEVRAGLFEMVIRKLYSHPKPELFQLLESGIQRLQTLAIHDTAGDEFAETVYRLHLMCAKMAGNARLQRMLTGLALQTLRYSKLGLKSVERRKESLRLWIEATQALKQGDVETTVQLTRQRIEQSGREAAQQLQSMKG